MYHDTAATGTADDPSDYLYFMSKKNTDNNVKDDVLKDFAGVDISGKTFHYLTVNARLVYYPNDEKGLPKLLIRLPWMMKPSVTNTIQLVK